MTKSKGQNFLVNQAVVERIIGLADLRVGERVLEIGPGLGILTEALVGKAGRVVAVELDRKLYAYLEERFLIKCQGIKIFLL